MGLTLIAVSTFRKNQAARELISSLKANDYNDKILLCDDSADEGAKPLLTEFPDIAYTGGKFNGGISCNKNRAIKYFLENKEYDNLLLLDDDCLFIKPGLIEHLEMVLESDSLTRGGKKIPYPFTTGFWTDKQPQQEAAQLWSGKGWTEDFPAKAASIYQTWHEGCHGFLMFLSREAVEKVGYFNKMNYFYGFEHSLYCSRILRAYGVSPYLFPIMKFTNRWVIGNDIPNNYSVNKDKVFEINGAQHRELLHQVDKGYGILISENPFKNACKKEKVYENP